MKKQAKKTNLLIYGEIVALEAEQVQVRRAVGLFHISYWPSKTEEASKEDFMVALSVEQGMCK